jgi:hypothetical protein
MSRPSRNWLLYAAIGQLMIVIIYCMLTVAYAYQRSESQETINERQKLVTEDLKERVIVLAEQLARANERMTTLSSDIAVMRAERTEQTLLMRGVAGAMVLNLLFQVPGIGQRVKKVLDRG